MWIWVVVAGLAIGLSLGALGGGGSILTVPVLVYLLGQSVPQATAGSLVIVGVSSVLAMLTHARAGHVRVGTGVVFGLLGTAGSLVGSRLSGLVAPHVLLSAFAALLLVVAVLMMRRSRRSQPSPADPAAPDAPEPPPLHGWSWPVAVKIVAAATVVGLLTGFFGVGGGFAVVPALVLALRFEMPTAVATSLLVITINSMTAFAARLHAGVVLDWPLVLAFTGVAVVGSVLGAKLSHRTDPVPLQRAFVVLLILVAIYLAAVNVPVLVG
jgi:uncharacterized membrane protein YfcA